MKDEAEQARPSLRERNKRLARDVVLDAAERLLLRGTQGDFSMRDLAAEAQVGFATPFNHFGSKNAIMQALSARLVSRMITRFEEKAPPGDALDRVLAMGQICTGLLLEQPAVYRAVIASLGAVGTMPGGVRSSAEGLWTVALAEGEGIDAALRDHAKARLPGQLALIFRGCLSFWTADELADDGLYAALASGVAALMLGLATPARRPDLLQIAGAGQAGQALADAADSAPL